jgi:hypothetical protein
VADSHLINVDLAVNTYMNSLLKHDLSQKNSKVSVRSESKINLPFSFQNLQTFH